MDRGQFFKEQHQFELERKNSLNTAVSLPVGIIAALGGGLYALASQISLPLSDWEIIQSILLVVAAAFLFRAMWALGASLGEEYAYPATPSKIENYYQKLRDYYRRKESAESAWDKYLVSEFIRCANRNSLTNDAKSQRLSIAKIWIMWATVVTFLAGMSSLPSQFETKMAEQCSNFAFEFQGIAMNGDNDRENDEPPIEDSSGPPDPPPGRLIKEDKNPKKDD